MPTYVYETIPQIPGVEPRRFEMRQSMNDLALKTDPVTGEPVRRVISGGFGFVAQKMSGSSSSGAAAPSTAACGPRCACCR
ncbi:MAG TPA: zinc ribbon domain-containing protein [Opitutus sp.]|nr:zinc ribbon domain-containing protein [Opitutus sp.]